VPPLRATVRLRFDIAKQIRRAQMYRRLLAHSRTPWRHTSSKATPPPMSLEDFQQNLFYLRSGFVFAALAVCHHYAQLCVSASILLSNLAAISSCTVQFHTDPMVVRGDDKLCTNQHPPYVPGGLSKNSILPPFWVGACLVHHKLPLRTADVLVCPRHAIINATRVALMPQRRI
jgi:hypothetical protein